EISEVDEIHDNHEHEDAEIFNDMEGNHIDTFSKGSKGAPHVPKVDIEKSKIRQDDQLVHKLPNPPRIFNINSDGTGSEFFTKDRMQEETGRFRHDVIIVKSTVVLGQNPVYMHSYFKPLKTNEEIDEEFSVVADLQSKKISECKTIEDIAI